MQGFGLFLGFCGGLLGLFQFGAVSFLLRPFGGFAGLVCGLCFTPYRVGFCVLYLATQENQMIASQVILPGPKVGKVDGCQIAQKALEAAVPTLPPAK